MRKRIVADTVEEALDVLGKLPKDAKFRIYNKDAMAHTSVAFLYFEPGNNAGMGHQVILSSSVIVTVEDYD